MFAAARMLLHSVCGAGTCVSFAGKTKPQTLPVNLSSGVSLTEPEKERVDGAGAITLV